ncbi:MAG TPA: glycosyltransferase [Herpetosiphonaceae bacterium]|nr:glycosyltransferase [Herpetosiphonaceae bacterium]
MRVLLLTAEYPPQPGGVGDYTAELAAALTAQGVAVAVLTGAGEGADGAAFPVWRRVRNWSRRLRADVQAAMTDWRADLLHIQYQTGAFGMKPAINMLPSRLDAPAVVTMHDLHMPYLAPKVAPLRRYVTRLLIESCRAVVVTNAEDQARLLGVAPVTDDPDLYALSQPLTPPPVLIPIGVNIAVQPAPDRAALRRDLGLPADGTLVAYFGLMNHTKGVHTIIESLQYVPETTHAVIIGGGAHTPEDVEYDQLVRATIERLGVADRVHWTGYLSAEEVSRTLQAADMAALPFSDGASYRRGSLLAALAHGLPTITTPAHLPLEPALRDEREVLFVDAGDSINLALAVERLTMDADLRASMAERGRVIAGSFRWDAIAAQHRDLYGKIG